MLTVCVFWTLLGLILIFKRGHTFIQIGRVQGGGRAGGGGGGRDT